MSKLRYGPVMVQPSAVIDDGENLMPAPPIAPQQVALAAFKGSKFYDDLMAELPALQAEHDAANPPPAPNRAARRANAKKSPPQTNGKVHA